MVGDEYNGLKQSLEFIRQLNAEKGPFDGVLGFSQGGCLAAILCAQKGLNHEDCILPGLKFGVVLSGFMPADPLVKALFDTPVPLPCFFGYGKTDFKRDECIKLSAKFEDAIVVEHAADHQVPRKNGGAAVDELKKFLLRASSL